jgi:putative redox protein
MPQLRFGIYDNGVHTDADFGKLSISGQDEFGFRPYILMTSAVAGCGTGVLRRELAARGVDYEDIKVVADVTRNAAEANRIERIDLQFLIKPKGEVSTNGIQDAVEAMLATSSMIQTVRDSITIAAGFSVVTE